MDNDSTHDFDIAIVGMAGRLPGAGDVDCFWQNLSAGVESIRFFSDEELLDAGVAPELLANPAYVKAGTTLDQIEWFDAAFFGYSPREAALIDPQQRLFLECVWEVLERAGYDPETFPGRIGLYAGSSANTYVLFNLAVSRSRTMTDLYPLLLSNEKDFLATRVAYKLNLRGPCLTVQTACSTSLVAVHLACQSLLNGECDMALAGGVSVRLPQPAGYLYQEGGILSPDGHCRAFDAEARGTVNGSGAGVVLLKRLANALADGDQIAAVIKGSAINNDGAAKIGFTAPSVDGQAEVIAEALSVAHVPPESITYIEAHGTGTPLGDPIEIAALSKVFGQRRPDAPGCAIGSLKTNVGHLDAAAGVAGLIKTALALSHRQLPPSLHFQRPNLRIDFAHSPFSVNAALSEWRSSAPLRAGVSSFGIGGTNAHVVLEEAPACASGSPSRPWQVLTLSARSAPALEEAAARLASHLRETPGPDLADVAYTLLVGRRAFSHRRAIVCQDRSDALAALGGADPQRVFTAPPREQCPPVAFLFPGQGAQHPGMAHDLYRHERVFRDAVDTCAALLRPHLGCDIRDLLYPDRPGAQQRIDAAGKPGPCALDQTWLAQPALFTVEYALAQLWMSWGVRPQALLGHSLGEYVAACLAGVWSLADTLAIVAVRGRLMQEQSGGVMLSVPLSEEAIRPLLDHRLDLAAVNGAALVVVGGDAAAIEQLEQRLAGQGVSSRRLRTSHAFHSRALEPSVEPFVAWVSRFPASAPSIPFLSNLTGDWITAAQATDPAYWGRQFRHTVRFADNLAALLQTPAQVLIEVGPGQTLRSLAAGHPQAGPGHTALASLRRPKEQRSDYQLLLSALAGVWLAGVPIDWPAFYADERRLRLPLPTYPFQRQRHWIDAGAPAAPARGLADPAEPAPCAPEAPAVSTERAVAAIWEALLGVERVGPHDNFFELGGDSLLALQLLARMREELGVALELRQIIEAPTVAAMVSLVERQADAAPCSLADPASLIVKIQPEGSNLPLFCVHPAGGTVLCYAKLAMELGPDQPLYGIQSPGFSGVAEHTTIEETAASYIAAIRTIQPHGPYLLAGLSYGGNVAFEMARQLEAQGESTPLLAMFDSHPPLAYHYDAPDDLRFIGAFPLVFGMYLGTEMRLDLDELRVLEPERQLDAAITLMRQSKALDELIDMVDVFHLFQFWKAHHHALRVYDPPLRALDQPITLFRASESQPPEILELLNIHLPPGVERDGWGRLTTAGITIYDAPGSHYTMLNEPHISALASRLRACIETVLSSDMYAIGDDHV